MKNIGFIFCMFLLMAGTAAGQSEKHTHGQDIVSASWIREHITINPVTTSWIEQNLRSGSPKLILTDDLEAQIKNKLEEDALVRAYYEYLKQSADEIIAEPVLKREKVGRRLLGVSREAVRRISTLALIYRIELEEKYLNRLAEEIDAVSNFSDWNPSHFLDVAEMSYAVATGLDWAGAWLPERTVQSARSALKKHILLSFEDKDYNWWINAGHNWNQVCHTGLSAAALVLADEDPELAARVIHRAVEKLPLALAAYSPDGAYPEGPTYWDYGTSYNLLALAFYESALGTDFNLPQAPGFMESAIYRMVVVAPSGKSFNYFDAGYGDLDLDTRGNLAWFAQQTSNSMYLQRDQFLSTIQETTATEEPPRLSVAYLAWLAQFEAKTSGSLPVYWKADGHNPVAIFRAEDDEKSGFYLGTKGGSASVNHANMDAGSFIFELNGVRWSVDPGNQSYNELEQTIGSSNLWDQSQNSIRWNLLTKGNQFHSTLTINGQRHNVDGFAPITEFQATGNPKIVALDLSEIFKGQLNNATRRFKKMDARTLRVEDEIEPSEVTETVTWAMMTQAEVMTVKNGAILRQDDKELRLKIIEPAHLNVSVISLYPPPLSYDKKIEGLKRIEINIPSYLLDQGKERIVVELVSDR